MSINSFGVSNMIDVLSGKNYIYFPDAERERELKDVLMGHRIKKVNNNTLELDNGMILEFMGNEGCCCGAGCYSIEELNECNNIITDVEFEDEVLDNWGGEHSFKIFVFTENKKIKLMQCDGDDGNGYYGTGYHISVKLKDSDKE